METITVSYTYNIKQYETESICLTECGKVINTKTGKELKQFLNGINRAVYIEGKAVNIKDFKPYKKEVECPF